MYLAPFFNALGINLMPSLFFPFNVKKILPLFTVLESMAKPWKFPTFVFVKILSKIFLFCKKVKFKFDSFFIFILSFFIIWLSEIEIILFL